MHASETSRALNVHRFGTEHPETIVLAHGFGSDQTAWMRYVPALHRRQVVLYDLAGSGLADSTFFDPARHDKLEGHADDLLQILHDLAIERCTLVGHSASGMIGILAAIEQPERFEKLILVGASARYLNGIGYRGGFDHEMVQGLLAAITVNFREVMTNLGTTMMDKPIDDPAAQTFLASLLRMQPDKALVMARAIFMSDFRDRLRECTVPSIVLQTRKDPAVPLEAAEYLRESLQQATLDIIDATGHLPHISAPEAFSAALLRHVADTAN